MGEEYTYSPLVKYIIHAKMFVDGVVERHDIIGAIFGQLDGLLPSNLDLQELQRIGKLERINVRVSHKDGKTYANIEIPCNLSKLEVAILSAALETIDRVGPSKAEIVVTKIEDIRKAKRNAIIKRAAELLRKWDDLVAPESVDLLKRVEEESKKSRIILYGPEKLPAGPGVLSEDEIIIVEGRSDVINLMRHGYDNVIAVEGTRIPESIIDLSKKKITTAFVDGDRSGLLILKELLQVADIDYIARAPLGKEVEHLSLKEIKKALSKRITADAFKLDIDRALELLEKSMREEEVEEKKEEPEEKAPRKEPEEKAVKELDPELKKRILLNLRKLLGTGRFAVLDENAEKVIELGKVKDLSEKISDIGVDAKDKILILDGIINQSVIDLISDKKIKIVVGRDITALNRVPENIVLLTLEQLT
ncbi:MAG: DNA primase DnaG [Candidatus Njordarchaeia archaeon]